MVWFRECWHEEVLRQLRQGLTKCYQVAFETRGDGELKRLLPLSLKCEPRSLMSCLNYRGKN